MKEKYRQLPFYLIAFAIIPSLIVIGIVFSKNKNYALISVLIALFCMLPFFIRFEKTKNTTREIVLIAVMVALTVVSRVVFAPLPSFKPITAMVIIAGVAFGSQAGFMTGAISALVSNIFFGQGPWTPFQMFSWGIIGFLAGVLFCDKKIRLTLIAIYGAISGVVFSVIMDIWTVFAVDNTFNFARYAQTLLASLPFMLIYMVSNIIFIALLTKPFLKKTERIKQKFGVFEKK